MDFNRTHGLKKDSDFRKVYKHGKSFANRHLVMYILNNKSENSRIGKAHPFSEKGIVTPDELHNQNFILREKGSGTRAIFEQLMRSHHVPYKVKWESNSTPAIIDAVSRNLGLGFVSERCVAEKIENGLIYRCPVQNMNLKRFFYICYHQYHPVTSQMQDFINYINSLPTDFH